MARVARFYGVDPFRLTPLQRLALSENVLPLWAEEVLRERGGGLSNVEVYELTRLATGSEEAAQDARSRRISEELRAGKTPEV